MAASPSAATEGSGPWTICSTIGSTSPLGRSPPAGRRVGSVRMQDQIPQAVHLDRKTGLDHGRRAVLLDDRRTAPSWTLGQVRAAVHREPSPLPNRPAVAGGP